MSTPVSIGQRFTQLIQHLGLSKNAFAQSLDKTATVIQHLVDERNKPGYDLLCKVFEAYPNVSKDWLMEGAGPMMKPGSSPVGPAVPEAVPVSTPTPATSLFAAIAPVGKPALPPVALVAPAPALPVAPAPPTAATVPAPAPDPAYLTAALQTQYLQHQLALAEQRNQHLLAQQALMQQLVAVLQRSVSV